MSRWRSMTWRGRFWLFRHPILALRHAELCAVTYDWPCDCRDDR